MTTIYLARPDEHQPNIQVFGAYDGEDDRYTFAVRSFEAGQDRQAEAYAYRLIEIHPDAELAFV